MSLCAKKTKTNANMLWFPEHLKYAKMKQSAECKINTKNVCILNANLRWNAFLDEKRIKLKMIKI